MRCFIRIVLWALAIAFGVACGVLVYLYISFNHPRYDDVYPVVSKNLSYFSKDYDQAREVFRNRAAAMKIRYPQAEVSRFSVRSPMDTDLTVDWCYIPAFSDTGRILVLSSGVHGVEGYVGSAVQGLVMDQYIDDQLLEGTAILLIHGINPWGFKYSRRVTENNVDLNRNCSVSGDLYDTPNPGYDELWSLLNPQVPLDMSGFSRRFFFLTMGNTLREYSRVDLKQAVLQGQYVFPEGVFYGGIQPEPQILDLIPVLRRFLDPYGEILVIDLHTGYGERGRLHLMSKPMADEDRIKTEELFEGFSIDWGNTEGFYTVNGSFPEMLEKIALGKDFIRMTFEFGTLDSQTTMGSIRSLNIMVAENQGANFGYESEDDYTRINDLFLDMFFPNAIPWRSHAIELSKEVLDEVIPRFSGNQGNR